MNATRIRVLVGVAAIMLVGVAFLLLRPEGTGESSGTKETVGAPELADRLAFGSVAAGVRVRVVQRWEELGASISGTIREQSGGPVVGADVCAWVVAGAVPTSIQREPVCTTSGAEGRYRLEALPPVFVNVYASAPRYAPGKYEKHAGADGFQLQPGEVKSAVDIELASGGVLIQGVVKDIAGGEVEGALVSSEFFGSSAAGSRGRARATSDEHGAFTMWVGPGQIYLTAEADGYLLGSSGGPAPGHAFELQLTPESLLAGVVVRAGTDMPVEGARVDAGSDRAHGGGVAFTDEEGHFRIDRLGPGRYKPTVDAEDGHGSTQRSVHLGLGESFDTLRIEVHPAVTVRARIVVGDDDEDRPCEAGGAALTHKATKRSRSSRTNADGTIEFSALLPGEYDVNVWCHAMIGREQAAILVAGEPIADLLWGVDQGLSITGVVVGPMGHPVSGASVSAQPKTAPPRGRVAAGWGSRTDADGRFEVAGLLEGSHAVHVEVRHPDLVAPVAATDVEVRTGGANDIRLQLEGGGAVEGRVVDHRGGPVALARVELRGDQYGQGGESTSRDDGTFAIVGVRPQKYRAVAVRGTEGPLRAPGARGDDIHGERVVVRSGETERLQLTVEDQSGTIRGRVIDEDGGPVHDAFVHAQRESERTTNGSANIRLVARWGGSGKKPVLTDENGDFELVEVGAGTHTIFATRKGGGEGTLEHVDVGAADAVVRIAQGASLSGSVLMVGGRVPRRFDVYATARAEGFSRREEFFETAGVWSMDELPAGTYELFVEASEGRGATKLAVADAEVRSNVVLEMSPNVDVKGTVVDLDSGAPIANVTVTMSPRRGGASFEFGGGGGNVENVSDAMGKFLVRGAPSGKVRVVMTPRASGDESYGFTYAAVTIPAGGGSYLLPPLGMAAPRIRRGERPGDLGFELEAPSWELDVEDVPLTVALIRPGGAAASAGLAPGDVITSVDAHDVTGENRHRYKPLTRVPPGTTVTLGLRDGKRVEVVAAVPP